jgi:NurA-like 5'-3' nuclease
LLALSSSPLNQVEKLSLSSNPFRTITDRTIFERILKPGFRSSLFIQRSRLNAEFKSAGHEIYFFYLHTDAGDNIVRVEVPEWVASSQNHLDTVHNALLEQCKHTAGYPYALIRAHELAAVSNLDRQNFETIIQSGLLDSGLRLSHSQKAESKRWTRAKRRHRL